MTKLRKKIYASSSSFMDGDLVTTQYSSGCLRMILAKAAGFRTDIKQKFMDVGEINELRFYKTLVDSNKYSLILDETPVRRNNVIGGVAYSSRTDFLTWEPGDIQPIVHECKATFSSGLLSTAKKGEPRMSHLAQIVSYMTILGLPKGIIWIHGYSEKKNKETGGVDIVPKIRRDTKEPHEYRFDISFSEDGTILINGRRTSYTQKDYISHFMAVGELLNNPVSIPKRPLGGECDRECCSWCDLKTVCRKSDDEGLTVDEFINEAKSLPINTGD